MDEIRPWLYIGSIRDTANEHYLGYKSIQAMLQLAAKVDHPSIEVLYLSVEDFKPLNYDLLKKGVKFIREHKRSNHRILVACGAGINRSSYFCTAALNRKSVV